MRPPELLTCMPPVPGSSEVWVSESLVPPASEVEAEVEGEVGALSDALESVASAVETFESSEAESVSA